ncbi:hypothetical protein [Halobacillus salinus]|uniref:hypothetical protein n=1 Tax=Halobacillus salinus TaxID=192814 RepID=UPI0009A760B8|nr:hypothetical protein [Halobacillus salinus]
MDFYTILEEEFEGYAYCPYVEITDDGYKEGVISIDWLNKHFGMFNSATDMIAKCNEYNMSHTVLYFEWLVEQEKLTM